MKEVNFTTGGRRWHGTDFVLLQKENLDILQGFFSTYGICVVQGCTVSSTVNTWSISAGLICINTNDGYKIARFPGVSNLSSLAGYIAIVKTTNTKLYDNGTTALANYSYDAAYYASLPGGLPSGGFMDVSNMVYFPNALLSKQVTAWNSLSLSGTGYATGTLYYRKNFFSNTLQIRGSISPTTSVASTPPLYYFIAQLPTAFIPANTVAFPCFIRYHNLILEENGYQGVPLRQITGEIVGLGANQGVISFGLVKTTTGSLYTASFSTNIPMD
jgi:hypothetical protein